MTRFGLAFMLITSFAIGLSFNPEDFVGQICTLSGPRVYKGICKKIQDCPSALSNLRAGVSPTICALVDKTAVVCCQTESRISAIKCREYTLKAMQSNLSHNGDKTAPLLPFVASSKEDNDEKDKVIKKPGSPELSVAFIVRGQDAGQNDFPHMVALGYQMGQKISWLCGGTLISDQFVLSAAHCVHPNRRGKLTKVLLGDIKLHEESSSKSTSRLIVNVKEVITHPNYKSTLKYNDISIIKLASKVKLSPAIKPACLPQPKDRLELVSQLTATGWGLTEFAGKQSETLQFAELLRISQQSCNKEYEEISDRNFSFPNGIIHSLFCAGDQSSDMKDTCEGDSGGGLVLKRPLAETTAFYVIGVTSFGSKYCGYGLPSVMTNVMSFLNWIEQTVWPQ